MTTARSLRPERRHALSPETHHDVMLRPSAVKMWLLLVGSSLFVVGGLLVLRQPEKALVGWLITAFFGLCALVGAISLLPGASWLRLTRDGFTCCNLYRRHFTPWRNVKTIGVASVRISPIRKRPMLGWNFVTPPRPKLISLNRALGGFDATLPDNYGMKHSELADLMTLWWTHHTASPIGQTR